MQIAGILTSEWLHGHDQYFEKHNFSSIYSNNRDDTNRFQQLYLILHKTVAVIAFVKKRRGDITKQDEWKRARGQRDSERAAQNHATTNKFDVSRNAGMETFDGKNIKHKKKKKYQKQFMQSCPSVLFRVLALSHPDKNSQKTQ